MRKASKKGFSYRVRRNWRLPRECRFEETEALATWHMHVHNSCMYFIIYLPGQRYLRPGLFEDFFREVVKGRRDYENLLPMTIGINTNKL